MVEIALFQPDIAPNTATIVRMAACLGLTVRIIEPAGFLWTDSAFRRAGMDYLELAKVVRHSHWQAFLDVTRPRRLVLMTTKGTEAYSSYSFRSDDIILMGRESAGVPDEVHAAAAARLRIPMLPDRRSMNVALACAMVTGEALRQTRGFPAT
jgi:tRNA (cytidine/uridine-2'-O-)-methyltransferase